MVTDILIIGAGVTGCAVARVLSRYSASVTVVDRACDVAEGATKANSGIVHGGYDAVPGTLKARFNVAGAAMYPALSEELGVPYSRPGAMVLGYTEEDRKTLGKLLQQGIDNGVEQLRIIERDEILALEPNTNPEVLCALLVPTSGLTSPFEMAFAMADHAAINGVTFRFNTPITGLAYTDGAWSVQTPDGGIRAKVIVNCAGTGAAVLHNLISDTKLHITNRRGQYWLLDRAAVQPFTRTMFLCPTKMGKGVLVSPTVHGNLLLGPTAEDIPDELDVATTAEGLASVTETAKRIWPGINTRTAITNFSGVRAHEDGHDFVIGPVSGAENAFEAAGIESPGLSAAPAVGEYLGGMIAEAMGLEKKAEWKPLPKRGRFFHDMSDEERAEAIRRDPLNGKVVCRCEVVTEAEIREAVRRPVGATTIDGVKRRTRAGMGRCQGGFCSPRVAEIIAEELNIPITKVTKNGPGGELLTGTLAEALKEVQA